MDRIIDAHSHIGDNLYPNGGDLIKKIGVKKKRIIFDPITLFESNLYRSYGIGKIWTKLFRRWNVIATRERNFTATRENMRKSMDEAGISFTVCLPISTHFVTFSDIKSASEKDRGIIPFTGIDHTKEYDFESTLAKDVTSGARGLKLHPTIQRISLTDKRTFDAVEAFAPHKLPVLFHCGISSYYLGKERSKENPQYGAIGYAKELVEAFPNVSFIAGHAGLFEVDDVMAVLGDHKNVWVDTSFQPPEIIRKLIKTFGPEKVLYGSDWPFGSRLTSIKSVKQACKGDKELERKIFFENAAELMKLSV